MRAQGPWLAGSKSLRLSNADYALRIHDDGSTFLHVDNGHVMKRIKLTRCPFLRPRAVSVAVIVFSIAFTFLGQSGLVLYTTKSKEKYEDGTSSHLSADRDKHHALPPSCPGEKHCPPTTNTTVFHIQKFLNNRRITKIRILGERHSGTTFFEEYLKRCFPTIDVQGYLLARKHWFQPTPKFVKQVASKYGPEGLAPTFLDENLALNMPQLAKQAIADKRGIGGTQPLPSVTWWDISQRLHPETVFEDTLVIVFFRNPYQWMEAMRLKPHHWPNHCNITMKQGLNVQQYRNIAPNIDLHSQSRPRRSRRLQDSQNDFQDSGAKQLSTTHTKAGGKIITKSLYQMEPLSWDEFVTRPMILVEESKNSTKDKGVDRICQKGYPFGAISPCDYSREYLPPHIPVPANHMMRKYAARLPASANDVVYELRRDRPNNSKLGDIYNDDNDYGNSDLGNPTRYKPYQHPLELRAAKIRNFLGVPKYWKLGGFVSVRYESIVRDGAAIFVEELSKILDVPKPQCPSADGSQPKQRPPRALDPKFTRWITQHTDWEEESRIGYAPEDENGAI